jgi:uncharacterized protein
VARLRADPQGFLDAVNTPAILDEVQNAPDVLAFVRTRIDRRPRRVGQWPLSGSQETPLMQGVSESMAGRAAILQLYPLSSRESAKITPPARGYPEAVARPGSAQLWFSSYLQTYRERDVRAVTAVGDIATFRRFLALVAARSPTRPDLAAPLGVSVPTVSQWLSILEITAQILMVPPFYGNLGKRLIRSPKVYVADSGLACHLLGIASGAELAKSPFAGALFEGFIAAEIVKAQVNAGKRRERLVESRAGRTVMPAMAAPMQRLAGAAQKKRAKGTRVDMFLVHQPAAKGGRIQAVAPGVQALPWREFVKEL